MLILSPAPGGGVSMAPIVAVLEGILERLDAVASTPLPKRKPRSAKSKVPALPFYDV